jgi:hypothetical protein
MFPANASHAAMIYLESLVGVEQNCLARVIGSAFELQSQTNHLSAS